MLDQVTDQCRRLFLSGRLSLCYLLAYSYCSGLDGSNVDDDNSSQTSGQASNQSVLVAMLWITAFVGLAYFSGSDSCCRGLYLLFDVFFWWEKFQ